MFKLIIFTLLLLAIYQWDDMMKAIHYVMTRIRKKEYRELVLHTDKYVSVAMAIITMPLILNYLVVSEGDLSWNLLIVGGVLALFWLIANGLGVFVTRLDRMQYYEGIGKASAAVFAIAGMFQPILRTVPWNTGRDRKALAHLALMLSVPVFLGLLFRNLYEPGLYRTEFFKYIDMLIVVMVGGMFMHITIGALRKHMQRSNMPIMGYFRIVLGLAAAFLMISGYY